MFHHLLELDDVGVLSVAKENLDLLIHISLGLGLVYDLWERISTF